MKQVKPKPSKKDSSDSGSLAIKAMLAEPQIPNELRVKSIKLMGYAFNGLHGSSIYNAIYRDPLNSIVARFEYKTGKFLQGINDQDKIEQLVIYAGIGDLVTIVSIFLEEMLNYPNIGLVLKCDLIAEVNRNFSEHKVMYKFYVDGSGRVRAANIKSTYLYEETVATPTSLLTNEEFQGPLEEFEIAIDDFSKGDNKDAIHHAHQALDGTMDAILDKLGYTFDPNRLGKNKKPNAAHRIEALIEKGVIHKSLDALFKSAGTPRNLGPGAGHTQGLTPKSLEPSCAALTLHLCGTLIVYLIERYEE